jgi:hypothetical protein
MAEYFSSLMFRIKVEEIPTTGASIINLRMVFKSKFLGSAVPSSF